MHVRGRYACPLFDLVFVAAVREIPGVELRKGTAMNNDAIVAALTILFSRASH
jgi:hypothetical protein